METIKRDTFLGRKIWDRRVTLDYVLVQGYSENQTEDTKEINMLTRIQDNKTLVVSAFPGTGKSFYFESNKDSGKLILDSDSSKFDKAKFPQNYIEHIKENIGKADVIFVSSHKIVRDALVKNGIDFILVYPRRYLKEEYLERYRNRGSSEAFIKLVKENWDAWITELQWQESCFQVKVRSGVFISDVLSPNTPKT